MNNPYLLTLPQLMSAKKKIGRVAAFFDPTKTSLKGFEATVLTPTEFREQLRRGLDIIVTNAELGALVFLFDKTGDGVVDCVEFTNEFYRLGKLERTKFTSSQMDEAKRIKEWKAKNKEIKAKRFEHFNYTHVATSWTEDQENEAIRKIARVAFSYDSLKDSAGMQGFMMSNYITASEFKELMRRNFEVNLTPEETGALLNMFDRGGIGLIDCKEFIYQFFRIGRTQKEEHNHRNNSIAAMRAEMEKERLMQIEEKYSKAVVARMVPATEKDRQSAFDKIRHAAVCYKGDSAFSGNLWKSFESDCLDPTAFKSLLKTNFEILLSPGELSALVSMFDANGDGNISCVEFISTFFRIALNERSHRMAIKREKDYQLQREREERIKLKEASAVAGTQTKVIWPLLPDDNGDFPEVSVDSSHVPGPAVADLKTMLKHRARPSMQSILSPVRGGGAPSAGSAPMSSSSSSSHKHSQSMADMFPKASKDTKVRTPLSLSLLFGYTPLPLTFSHHNPNPNPFPNRTFSCNWSSRSARFASWGAQALFRVTRRLIQAQAANRRLSDERRAKRREVSSNTSLGMRAISSGRNGIRLTFPLCTTAWRRSSTRWALIF